MLEADRLPKKFPAITGIKSLGTKDLRDKLL